MGVTLAVLQTILHPQTATVLTAFFAVAAYLGVRKLGYVEFRSLERILLRGEWRGVLRIRRCLNEYHEALSAAQSLEECWEAVAKICRVIGYRYVALDIEGRRFQSSETPDLSEDLARVLVPLSGKGQIAFLQIPATSGAAMWIAPIVEALEEKLAMERDRFISAVDEKPMESLAVMPATAN